jgi:ketosteroid isomerase-like protein
VCAVLSAVVHHNDASLLRTPDTTRKRPERLPCNKVAATLALIRQVLRIDMEDEILKLEEAFAEAIVKNDLEGLGRIAADDWIIIDPNGEIVDRARFFEVIKSGVLTHDTMESGDFRVRLYGDVAVVTAITSTNGKFMGEEFSTRERATDVFVRRDGRWRCVLTHLTRLGKK